MERPNEYNLMYLTKTGIVPLSLLIFGLLISSPAFSGTQSTLDAVDKSIRLRQYTKAVKQLQPLLKRNVPEAQYLMAELYRSGRGVKSNLDKATKLYKKAAINDIADAQYKLASILEKQDPNKSNPAAALKWYEAAASQGHRKAIRKLAYLKDLKSGKGGRKISKDRIFSAIRTNDLNQIRALIRQGVDLDILDASGQSAFMVALKSGHRDMSEILQSRSSRLDTPDRNNDRPIHIATRNGFIVVVIDLIRKKVNINARDHLGNTALMIATRHDDKKLIELLLDNKADHRIKNKKSQSAPQLAQALNLKKAKSIFVKRGIRLPKQNKDYTKVDIKSFQKTVNQSASLYKGWPLLNVASLLGEQAIAGQLLDQGANIQATDKIGNSAMHRAASKGQIGVVKLLISRGGNINAVNKKNETPLYLAAASGKLKTVKLLVKKGADTSIVAKNKTSALSTAIKNQHPQTALALVNSPLDKKSVHRALLLAIQNKMEPLSVALAKIDDRVDQTDSKNRTALWYSADIGLSKATVALLRKNRRTIDLADTNGYTALARAVSAGHLYITKILVSSGASLHSVTGEKNSILMLSVLSGKQDILKFLLSKDIDIDAQNILGETALMLAAANGFQTTADVLIQAGANTQIRNLNEENAYQIATSSGHLKTAEFIKENSNIVFKLFN